MFRKEQSLAERSRSALKNKEIRTLRSELLSQFSALNEQALNDLLPPKADVIGIKLANRTILYSVAGSVLFFDLEGRNRLFPSVYALWKCPTMLRTFICHAPVSRFVLRGADFMTPGLATIEGLDNLRVGERCCLRILGNPLPFAVGESLIDYSVFTRKSELKGKAMNILHSYGDLLADKVVPNAGFSFQEIRPLPKVPGEVREDEEDDEEGEAEDDEDEKAEEGKIPSQEVSDASASGVVEAVAADAAGETSEQLPAAEDTDQAEADSSIMLPTPPPSLADQEDRASSDEEGDSEEPHGERDDGIAQISEADMNNAILRALSLALRYIIKDSHLPILASKLWALMLRCHIAATSSIAAESSDVTVPSHLDMRRSSFRKVAAFLQHCQREGILVSHTSQGVTQITSVARSHPITRAHKVDDVDRFKAIVNNTSSASAGNGPAQSTASQGNTSGGGGAASRGKIDVVELVKFPKAMREIFGDQHDEAFGDLLRLSAARQVFAQFIRTHDLQDPQAAHCLRLSYEKYPELCQQLRPLAVKATGEKKGASTATQLPPPPPSLSSEERPYGRETEEEDEVDGGVGSHTSDWIDSVITPMEKTVIGLRRRPEGLINLDDMGNTSIRPAATTTATTTKTSKQSATWKPISLPPSRPATSRPGPSTTSSSSSSGAAHAGTARPGSKAKDKTRPEEDRSDVVISKEDFVKGCMSKLTAYHAILRPGPGGMTLTEFHCRAPPKIAISTECRAGNKMVTLVRGLDHFGVDLSDLSRKLQKR